MRTITFGETNSNGTRKTDRLFNVGPKYDFNQKFYKVLVACRLKYLYGF